MGGSVQGGVQGRVQGGVQGGVKGGGCARAKGVCGVMWGAWVTAADSRQRRPSPGGSNSPLQSSAGGLGAPSFSAMYAATLLSLRACGCARVQMREWRGSGGSGSADGESVVLWRRRI